MNFYVLIIFRDELTFASFEIFSKINTTDYKYEGSIDSQGTSKTIGINSSKDIYVLVKPNFTGATVSFTTKGIDDR